MSSFLLPKIVHEQQPALLSQWMKEQLADEGMRRDLIREEELREQSREFLLRFEKALQSDDSGNIRSAAWAPVMELLSELSRTRGRMGFTPTETAWFVFSLKRSLLQQVSRAHGADATLALEESLVTSELLDRLGLYTMETFQEAREEVIVRQQEEMLELSTPVVKLWDGVLALPLIGTLDSARTSVVMEALLEKIVQTGSEIAIIDITGVPTVDTLVAQHLLKTVAAARLMGADCIISGIRPQIAQTIVHLAIDLSQITTKATLAEALAEALKRSGTQIVRGESPRLVRS